MTSLDIVRYEGVTCKTDAVVVEGAVIQFLSVYGAPQQTKGIFSASRGVETRSDRRGSFIHAPRRPCATRASAWDTRSPTG